MEYLISLLISYGYWGMLVTAFIAGSFFPFSSEAVMTGLLAAGLDPWGLIIYGTIGNVAGGMFNYFVGRQGRLEWIEKYLHVKKEALDKARSVSNVRSMGHSVRWSIRFKALEIALRKRGEPRRMQRSCDRRS